MAVIKYNVVTAGIPYHETGVVNHHLTQRPFADIPASPAIAGDLQRPIAEPHDEDASLKVWVAGLESRLNQSSIPRSMDRLHRPQAPRNTGGRPPDDQKGYRDHALQTITGPGAIITLAAPAGSMFGASLGIASNRSPWNGAGFAAFLSARFSRLNTLREIYQSSKSTTSRCCQN